MQVGAYPSYSWDTFRENLWRCLRAAVFGGHITVTVPCGRRVRIEAYWVDRPSTAALGTDE